MLVDTVHRHAHLHGKRPAGDVVRFLLQVGIMLRLQQIDQVGTKRLRGGNDQRARGVRFALRVKFRARPPHLDTRQRQPFQKVPRGGPVPLFLADHVGVRLAVRARGDGLACHLVALY